MAKKHSGFNITVAGHTIDNVGEMVGKTVDKVAGDKIKIDAKKIGKALDKTNKNIKLDIGKKK